MKLLNLNHSPYATRVRIQIRKKGLAIDIVAPDLPLRTPEFLAKYPLGKVPVLQCDDGSSLSESTVIMEYLEDTQSGVSLRPDTPMARAQMNLLIRYADTHLGPNALFPIFKMLMAPGEKDFTSLLPLLKSELQKGENLLKSMPSCQERSLHLGDIALVPTLTYVIELAPLLGMSHVLSDYPVLNSWWQWVLSDAVVADSVAELVAAFKAFSTKA
jgi:glutathione S-transferase